MKSRTRLLGFKMCVLAILLIGCDVLELELGEDLVKLEEQEIAWISCDPNIFPEVLNELLLPLEDRLECATLLAPLDWKSPGLDTINLGILRVKAGDESKRKGAIFINPGGPGGDGLSFGALLGLVFATNGGADLGFGSAAPEQLGQVSESYDIIGFSPRGVGGSFQMFCGSNKLLPDSNFYTDRSPENVQNLLLEGRLKAEACKNNPLNKYIDTEQTVQDMDLMRKLLGDEKLNYLGFSYGSWLGSWYAKRFPENAGNIVLDANTEFSASFQESFSLQPLGFQRAFEDVVLAYAARYDNVFELGETKEEAYRVYEALSPDLKDVLLYGSLDLITNLYDSQSVGFIAASLSAAKGVDTILSAFEKPLTPETYGAFLEQVAVYTYVIDEELNASVVQLATFLANDYVTALEAPLEAAQLLPQDAVFTSVSCNDTPWNQDPAFYAEFGNEQNRLYPLIGGAFTIEPCAFWGKPSTKKPDLPKNIPPILMVQTGFDPATPVEGALRAFESLPNAHLVYIENEMSHIAFPYGTECVDAKVANYLLDGTLPDENISDCEALPLPGEEEVYPPDEMPNIRSGDFSVQAVLEPPQKNSLYDLVHSLARENAANFFRYNLELEDR